MKTETVEIAESDIALVETISEAAKVRAHSYGKVRGYRSATRTLRAGKWGA